MKPINHNENLIQKEINEKSNTIEPQFHFIAHKAGMDSIDKEKITKIVNNASRDSEYYKKQLEKKVKNEQKINEIKKKIEQMRKDKLIVITAQKVVEKKIQNFEKERNVSRWWVHFDLDMFYVACEMRDNPTLKDKPVAVGGMSMISTANYIARKFGVRSAMPGFIGKQLCPELILIPHNFQKYKSTSDKFKKILEVYDNNYESMGLDEANLDMTGYLLENNLSNPQDIEKLCYDIRMKINEATGITVSCGIAPNKMLAKMCSEVNKPNGQFMIKQNKQEILNFMEKLPIRKIPGIGNVNEQILIGLGIQTCKDVIDKSLDIYFGLTENSFDFFITAALGISRCYHELPEDRKSVSVSQTFQTISKVEDIELKIKELSRSLADDLKGYNKLAKQITLSLKTYEFDVRSKVLNLERYTNDEDTIIISALKLFKEFLPVKPLRLIGIKGSELINEYELHNALDKYFKPRINTGKCMIHGNNLNINSVNDDKSNIINDNSKLIKDNEKGDIDSNDRFNMDNDFNDSKESSKINPISTSITFGEILIKKDSDNSSNTYSNNENILNSKSILVNDIICPVCQMKFESSVNKTRINNHIDKCLLKSMTNDSKLLQDESTNPNDNNLIIKPNNKNSKRKAESNLNPCNDHTKRLRKNNDEGNDNKPFNNNNTNIKLFYKK